MFEIAMLVDEHSSGLNSVFDFDQTRDLVDHNNAVAKFEFRGTVGARWRRTAFHCTDQRVER